MDKPHKKLEPWKEAMRLVPEVYRATGSFPPSELHGLTNQIRRAAVSVPVNAAEGAARQTRKEFIQFLHTSRGSLSELDTLLEISLELGYLERSCWTRLNQRVELIDKLLNGLIKHLRAKPPLSQSDK
jgi:four helix bundle protein